MGMLSNKDHDIMDAFIGAIIDNYKNGGVSKWLLFLVWGR